MPSTLTICNFAMYVIGEVESSWTWNSVNFNDPITIGMMQWYGTRAAGLLNRIETEVPTAYNMISDSLRSDLDIYPNTNRFWNTRYLTQVEGNSIIDAFNRSEVNTVQQNQAIEDFQGYISVLEGWGMSQQYSKALIFAMSMYHQSPSRAGRIIQSAGGNATLDRIYSVCLNDGTFGTYRTRYTTVYNRLNAWDGESEPPDFGQDRDDQEGGDASTSGENNGTDTTLVSEVKYILQIGDNLVIYGDGAYINGVLCYKTTGNTWIPEGVLIDSDIIESQITYIISAGDNLIMYGTGTYSDGVVCYPSAGQRWNARYNVSTTEIVGGNEDAGNETGNEAQKDVVNLYTSWVGRFAYSQGAGRLTPLVSGYGDCSSTIWYAYQTITGIDVGTYTGAMLNKGQAIAQGSGPNLPLQEMQLADLILYDWNGRGVGHVELYIGDNKTCGHGGPGNGPTIKEDAQAYAARANRWWVKRHL